MPSRHLLAAILTGMLAVGVGVPAAAQDGEMAARNYIKNTHRLDRTGISLDPDKTRAVHKAAVCAYRQNQRYDFVLRELPESEADRTRLFSMAFWSTSCGPTAVTRSLVPMFGRGVVAEIAYDRHFADGKKRPSSPFRTYAKPTDIARLDPQVRSALGYVDFGECVAAKAPDTVMGLFATDPASVEEKAVFASLGPAMSECLSPGLQLKMSRLLLRGFLAEGAYRVESAKIRGGAANA